MKYDILISGKKHVYDFPISWDQVSFGKFLGISPNETDILKIIALITGIDYDVLCRANIPGLEQLIEQLGFMKKEPVPVVPKTILGYRIPKDLGFETVGQFKDLNNYIKEISGLTPMEQFKKYPLFCAVYACPQMPIVKCNNIANELCLIGEKANEIGFGKYDWRKAEAMADEFLNAPCTEVIGIGNFTLAKLILLNQNIRPDYQKAVSRAKKFKLVLKTWLNGSALTRQWSIWKKGQGNPSVNLKNGQ